MVEFKYDDEFCLINHVIKNIERNDLANPWEAKDLFNYFLKINIGKQWVPIIKFLVLK